MVCGLFRVRGSPRKYGDSRGVTGYLNRGITPMPLTGTAIRNVKAEKKKPKTL